MKKFNREDFEKDIRTTTEGQYNVLKYIDLTPEQYDYLVDTIEALQQEIEQLKEQINTAKIGWDTYKTYSEQLEQQTAESNKIIETQRQEIEKLKATLADWKYNAKCDADHIAALTADKDEQAGRLMQYDTGIKQAIKWLTPHPSDGSRAVEKARLHLIALIGGKEE